MVTRGCRQNDKLRRSRVNTFFLWGEAKSDERTASCVVSRGSGCAYHARTLTPAMRYIYIYIYITSEILGGVLSNFFSTGVLEWLLIESRMDCGAYGYSVE